MKDLVGVTEIAEIFHLRGTTTVTNWHSRRMYNRFPEVVKVLAVGPIWDLEEVMRWYVAYKPANGRQRVGYVSDEDLARFGIEPQPKTEE